MYKYSTTKINLSKDIAAKMDKMMHQKGDKKKMIHQSIEYLKEIIQRSGFYECKKEIALYYINSMAKEKKERTYSINKEDIKYVTWLAGVGEMGIKRNMIYSYAIEKYLSEKNIAA